MYLFLFWAQWHILPKLSQVFGFLKTPILGDLGDFDMLTSERALKIKPTGLFHSGNSEYMLKGSLSALRQHWFYLPYPCTDQKSELTQLNSMQVLQLMLCCVNRRRKTFIFHWWQTPFQLEQEAC